MRLFVAVDLGEAVRRAIGAMAEGLAVRLASDRLVDRSSVTWVSASNLHLTLRFIGEVEADRSGPLAAAIRAPFDQVRFSIELQETGLFPPQGAPRVLWLGIGAGREALLELQREVERRVVGLGLPPEDRPFSAHLTLARFKRPPSPLLRERVGTLAGPAPAGRIQVDHVTLYSSDLSGRVPSYRSLARGALGWVRSGRGALPA